MPALPFLFFVTVLGLTGLMRLVELVVSMRRVRQRPAAAVAEPTLFAVMALLHAALVVFPVAEVVRFRRPFVPAAFLVALTVLVLASGLRVWTLRTLGRAWNVRIVEPEREAIVVHGPYRWIRHPNYLAVILEVAALPMLHNAWASCLLLSAWNAWVLARRIPAEERVLMGLPTWRRAMERRARLIPGLF